MLLHAEAMPGSLGCSEAFLAPSQRSWLVSEHPSELMQKYQLSSRLLIHELTLLAGHACV